MVYGNLLCVLVKYIIGIFDVEIMDFEILMG